MTWIYKISLFRTKYENDWAPFDNLIIFCYSGYGDFNVTKLVGQPMISTITGNIAGK